MPRASTCLAVAVLCALGVGCSSSRSSTTPNPQPSTPLSTSPAPTTTTTATVTPSSVPDLAHVKIALATVASGLSSPVALAWRHGDDRIYVAEQRGDVRIVDSNGQVLAVPVLTLSGLSDANEEGLLGITFSPDGTKLYVDETVANNDTHVDEYRMRGDVADPASRRTILVVEQPSNNHKGGEVTFGPDGMLYIGLGDGGFEGDPNDLGQNTDTLLSKILRIDPGGGLPYTIPADNPFVGRAGYRPETYMWGLRNPWRFSFDRATGDLWIGDVGQDTYEEIDYAPAGEKGINFGWSAREGFHAYKGAQPTGARDPLLEVAHSTGACAIVGGFVYRGRAIPALRGVYVFGDDCRPQLVGVVQHDGRVVSQRDLGPTVDQLTTLGEDDGGELYAVSRAGTLYRITAA